MNQPASESAAFSPAAYGDLIGALRARGYEPHSFADANPATRHLIVRHDVDFSLAAAVAMAEQERGLGLASTYFVLLRTEFYNPLSAEGLAAIKRIAANGHDIGLHFDAALYKGEKDVLEEACAHECSLLEAATDRPVTIVSYHRPASDVLGAADRLGGRLNAYGPRFIKEMGYCSDSRGAWHSGPPQEHPAVHGGRALQLLVHPFWWQAPALAPAERLRKFLNERSAFLDAELARHCTIHRPAGR